MLFNSKIKIIKQLNAEEYPWCNGALVISIRKGKASLILENYGHNSEYDIISALTFNGKPLIQCQLPGGCPTCAGMLATGYGIDKDSEEIKAVSNAINAEFVSLEKSVDNIKPLLGLLKDGVYVIADIPSYPTDGSGNFFWSVSNKLTDVPATTELYYNSGDFDTVYGMPVFLYPSQSTDCFNPDRVNHYLNTVSEKNAPRAIAYHVSGFLSILLDGHHKATAAALSGNFINCLTIIPVTYYQINPPGDYRFSRFTINHKFIPLRQKMNVAFTRTQKTAVQIFEGTIIKKQWEQKYISSAKFFPDLNEFANRICCDIKYHN